MERLTKRGDKYCDNDFMDSGIADSMNRLLELEDKLEDGRMIELPCKVYDTVFVISGDKVYECRLRNMLTYKAKNFNLEIGRTIDGKVNGRETVFLTLEAAEAALKAGEKE